MVQNISTFSALFDFFSISVILLGADIVCLKFFFEFMKFLVLLKVKFMVLFAVIDMYRLDGAGRGDTDNIKLVLYLCFICFIF